MGRSFMGWPFCVAPVPGAKEGMMAKAGKERDGVGGAGGGPLVLQRSNRGVMQMRKPRRNGWTMARRTRFLEILRETSNVTEAVNAVGMTMAGAYALKNRDPGFARQWMEALEQGYAELEMMLLRQALHGSETIEIVDDGKGGPVRTKKTHGTPHAMAIRLLLAHRANVAQFRAAQGIDRPGSEAVLEEIQRRLAETRRRLLAGKAETP